MHLTRRLAVAVAAALIAGPLLFAPALNAAVLYDCFFGDRKPAQGGYEIIAHACDGVGYADLVVTVRSGTAEGTHHCRYGFPWNGSLAAYGCQEA